MSAPVFPFGAIVGQDALREALLACAVDPAIGGVLVRGERGTAKSTAVRGLAPLLPPVRVAAGARYASDPDTGEDSPDGPAPAGAEVVERPVRLVELPVGATADRLVGTLDLDRALAEGARAFEPGLLAAAHRGILYVDEVNLLPDHLVDVLLDAAAMGRNHVERESVSVSHPARFLLVGTMNPEEGELRPQLLDRFGLSVDVAASDDPWQRVEIVRRRLAYDADPVGFAGAWAEGERALAARVAAARSRLGGVALAERTLLLIAGACARLGVDGLRADIVCARAAAALAALDGAAEVGEDHVRRAARLALAHRRRRGPFEAPGLDEEDLAGALEEARDEAGARDGADRAAQAGPDGDAGPEDGGARGGRRADDSDDARRRAESDGGARQSAPDGARAEGEPDDDGPDDGDDGPPGRGPAGPSSNGAGAGRTAPLRGAPAGTRAEAGGAPAPRAVAPVHTQAPGAPGEAPLLALAGRGRGARGRRSPAASRDGAPVDSRVPAGPAYDLALAATLRAAALRGGGRLEVRDVREHVRAGREGNLVVFCVDASGSMGARRRMATVKGAVLGLLLDAYQRRDRVALVTFRAEGADVALEPTASIERAAGALAALPTGGGTPVAAGLERAGALIARERRRDPDRRSLALVVTDGRASGGAAGRAAADRAAAGLGATADGVVVFDAEEGAVRLGLAGALAAAAGARLLPLGALASLTHAPARRAA